MSTHEVPLPRLPGDSDDITTLAGRLRLNADLFAEAHAHLRQIRDQVDAMESATVRITVLRIDDLMRRCAHLSQCLDENAAVLDRHADVAAEYQQLALRASSDDGAAHARLDSVRARLAGSDSSSELLWHQRLLDAQDDERSAHLRWQSARDELVLSATQTAACLVPVSGTDQSSSGRSSTAGPAVHLSGEGFAVVRAAMVAQGDLAIAPDAENDVLRDILNEIYGTYSGSIGDGRVDTALLHEIETGLSTHGKWHVQDTADQLIRLVELLEQDRKPGVNVHLSATDKAIAMDEVQRLWEALRTPVPVDSPLASMIQNNPRLRTSLRSAERLMHQSPSVSSISGIKFTVQRGGRPVPQPGQRVGRVLGGLGVIGDLLGLVQVIQMLDDPVAMNQYLCDMGHRSYCRLDPNLNMA